MSSAARHVVRAVATLPTLELIDAPRSTRDTMERRDQAGDSIIYKN